MMMIADRRNLDDGEEGDGRCGAGEEEEDTSDEEVIDGDTEGDAGGDGLPNDRSRGDVADPPQTIEEDEDASFDELTIIEEEFDEEEIVEDSDYDDDDEEEVEIVELDEEELLGGSSDDDNGDDDNDGGDVSMSGSGDYLDDSSAPPNSVCSLSSMYYYHPDEISINVVDDATATNSSARDDDSRKRQMEMHNSAINEGARKAMMEEIARNRSIQQQRVARRCLQRHRLEEETERLKSSTSFGGDSNLGGTSNGIDDRDGSGHGRHTEEEALQRHKERDRFARQRLIEEIKKVDLALSKNRETATRTLSATDVEKKKRALAELRRKVAIEELARNNSRLKAVQADIRLNGSSVVSFQSSMTSLYSTLVSPGNKHPSIPSKQTAAGNPSLAVVLDRHQPGSISSNVLLDIQAKNGDDGIESATLVSRLPGEPPFFRPEYEANSGGDTTPTNKTPTNGKASVGSRTTEESSTTDSNSSHDTCSTNQAPQNPQDRVGNSTDAETQSSERKAGHLRLGNPKLVLSPPSRPAKNPFFKIMDASDMASVPAAFRIALRGVPRSSRELLSTASPGKDTSLSPMEKRRSMVRSTKTNDRVADQEIETSSHIAEDKSESSPSAEEINADATPQDESKDAFCESTYYGLVDLQQGKVTGIDNTRREDYLSPVEFEKHFKMSKEAFSKLPKWKRDKTKRSLKLF